MHLALLLFGTSLCQAADIKQGDDPNSSETSAVDFAAIYKADVMDTVSGGLKRGTSSLSNLDLKLTLDGEKMLGWHDTTFFLYGLSNQGGRPNGRHSGTAQGIDNIEVDANTAKLYQAWVQRGFLSNRLAVLAGLYDLNSEFYVTDTSSLFLHPGLGIGSDFSQSGQNGPSIFPTASLALRTKAELTPDFYLQVAALDGVPGDPNNPHGTHIQLNKGDGTLVVAEAGYMRGDHQQVFLSDRDRDEKSAQAFGKYAFGVWHYTSPFDDLTAVDGSGNPIKHHNQGIYFLTEQALYHETNEPSQGLAAFLRLGVVNNDVNRFDQCFYVGAVYTGLIEGRDTDQLGLTYGSARNSSKYMAKQSSAGTPAEKSENVWELSYRSQLTPWLAVQPDIQYITNPDTNPQLGNATVLGIRFEMTLQ